MSGVASGKAAPLVGGPPGAELHTVVEELPSGAVGEMVPIVLTAIGAAMVPNAPAGANVGADVVVLAHTSGGFERMGSWKRPFLNQVLKLKTDTGGDAGNPFLVQVGGGNPSLQPARVKRSAGYDVLTFAGGWVLKVKVVSDF